MEKISPTDWVKALKLSDHYAEDYRRYIEESKKKGQPVEKIRVIIPYPANKIEAEFEIDKSAKKLCDKYKLRFPIDPDTPFHESDLSRLSSPINYFIPREFIRKLEKEIPSSELQFVSNVKTILSEYLNGRLAIFVDTMFSRDQIESEFDKIIQDWSDNTKQRNKESKEVKDIWEVYRLSKKEGKSLNSIAVEMLGSGGKPNYNEGDQRKLKTIRRAFLKARKIVNAVENRRTK